MMRLLAIARNAFVETIRQPIFGLLILVTFIVLVLTLPLSGYSMGRDNGEYKQTDQLLMVDLGLSTLLVSGLLLAAFSAAGVLAREIEDRTVLTVISKPVSRGLLVAGKYLGVSGAIVLGYYLCSLAFLMTVRHGVKSAVSDPLDVPVIVLGASAVGAAMIAALVFNYLFGWHYVSSAVAFAAVTMTLAMGLIAAIGKGWTSQLNIGVPMGVIVVAVAAIGLAAGGIAHALWGWRPGVVGAIVVAALVAGLVAAALIGGTVVIPGGPGHPDVSVNWLGRHINTYLPLGQGIGRDQLAAIVLTLMSVLVFVAVGVAASTRLRQDMTLLVCVAFFTLGSISQSVFGQFRETSLAARAMFWAWPNLMAFHAGDALLRGSTIPAAYVALAGAYAACQIVAILALGMALFQRRELEYRSGASAATALVSLWAWIGRGGAILLGVGGLALAGNFRRLLPTLIGLGLLVLAAGLWILWGHFARGAKWAYAAVGLLALAATGLGAAALFAGGPLPAADFRAVLLAAVGGLLLGSLLLPKTRHYFGIVRQHRRPIVNA